MELASTFTFTSWQNGLTGRLEITNQNDLIKDWRTGIVLDYPIKKRASGDYQIIGGAIAESEERSDGRYFYRIKPDDYNKELSTNESAYVFFNGDWEQGLRRIPRSILSLEFNLPEPTPYPPPPTPSTGDGEPPITLSREIQYWSHNSGATLHFTATNTGGEAVSPIVEFDSDFKIRDLSSDIWNAEIIEETQSGNGYRYRLQLSAIASGEEVSFGFNTLDATPEVTNLSYPPACGATPRICNPPGNAPQDGLSPPSDEPDPEPPSVGSGGQGVGGSDSPQPTPSPSPTTQRPSYNKSTGFYVKDGKIYDANGEEFIARGLNNMHVWFDTSRSQPATDALDNIADFGFNSVRIAWDMDFTGHGDRPHDWVLEQAIETAIANKLVPMVELHDFTGSNDTNDLLNRGVKWWTDRAGIWEKYEESLLINIANEFGDYSFAQGASRAEFPRVYKEAITRMRSAGIDNTLVIDPFHWGKEYDLISEYGKEILEHDPQKNVVFSVHFYNGYGEDRSRIKDAFDSITGQKLPLIIGEFGTGNASNSPTSGNIQEDYIMQLAEQYGVGTYPWAWHGDGHGHSMARSWEASSFNELTAFGQNVVDDHAKTAQVASIF